MRFHVVPLLACLAIPVVAQQVTQSPQKTTQPEIEPVALTLDQARKKHVAALSKLVEIARSRFMDGSGPLGDLLNARIALAEAQFTYANDAAARMEARKSHLAAAQEMYKLQKVRTDMGTGKLDEFILAEAELARAEVAYLELLEDQK